MLIVLLTTACTSGDWSSDWPDNGQAPDEQGPIKKIGAEGGRCFADGIFMPGLECRSGICVRVSQPDRGADLAKRDAMKPDAALKFDLKKQDIATKPDKVAFVDVRQPDISKPDLPKPDLPKPDIFNPDIFKPDILKPDIFKPDLPKPDLPKPDLPKPDLPPYCGNGVVDGYEECDGDAYFLPFFTCATFGGTANPAANCGPSCTSKCKFNKLTCCICGNARFDPYEDCEMGGTMWLDPNHKTCESYGYWGGGTLLCTSCKADTKLCSF
jgi:hypothetical protein